MADGRADRASAKRVGCFPCAAAEATAFFGAFSSIESFTGAGVPKSSAISGRWRGARGASASVSSLRTNASRSSTSCARRRRAVRSRTGGEARDPGGAPGGGTRALAGGARPLLVIHPGSGGEPSAGREPASASGGAFALRGGGVACFSGRGRVRGGRMAADGIRVVGRAGLVEVAALLAASRTSTSETIPVSAISPRPWARSAWPSSARRTRSWRPLSRRIDALTHRLRGTGIEEAAPEPPSTRWMRTRSRRRSP